jgi:hypothetical protein
VLRYKKFNIDEELKILLFIGCHFKVENTIDMDSMRSENDAVILSIHYVPFN